MVLAPLVTEQHRRATVCRDHQVKVTIVINVCVSSSPADTGSRECFPQRGSHPTKFPLAQVAEQMWRLGIIDMFLHPVYCVFDMPIYHEGVKPAIQVIVEEKTAKAESKQTGAPQLGAGSFVHKQSDAFVVVESEHFVREVADEDARVTRAVIVGSVHTHTGPNNARLTKCDAGHGAFLREGSIAVVTVKFVGFSVVGQEKVGPGVSVVVKDSDPQSLRARVKEACLVRGVFEGAVAAVTPKSGRCSIVGLRRAIGFVRPIQSAKEVGLGRPLQVVDDEEVEVAVTVIVEPCGSCAELFRAAQAGWDRHITKGAVAVVTKQSVLAQGADKQIVVSIVVVIADRGSHPIGLESQAGLYGDVCERPISVVAVELRRG